MRRSFLLIVAGVACAGFIHAADEPLPKAETLLDGYIDATGGKAAYEKRKSEVMHGTIEFAANGMKGTVTTYSDVSNNNYTVVDIEGVGKIESGVYNGQPWELSSLQGARLRSGAEKADAVRDSTFNGPVYWRKLYDKAETTGVEDVNGEAAYKVVLTPSEGKPQTVYFSKKSGFMIKRVATVSNPMGEIPMEMGLANYKNFGGIQAPTSMTQKVMGQEFVISVQDLQPNVDIPKDRFDPPAEIKKLMEKPAPAAPAK
jgi:hypothetical protein